MDHGLLSEVIHIRLHRGKADNRVNKLKLTLKLKWDEVAKWDCIFCGMLGNNGQRWVYLSCNNDWVY